MISFIRSKSRDLKYFKAQPQNTIVNASNNLANSKPSNWQRDNKIVHVSPILIVFGDGFGHSSMEVVNLYLHRYLIILAYLGKIYTETANSTGFHRVWVKWGSLLGRAFLLWQIEGEEEGIRTQIRRSVERDDVLWDCLPWFWVIAGCIEFCLCIAVGCDEKMCWFIGLCWLTLKGNQFYDFMLSNWFSLFWLSCVLNSL